MAIERWTPPRELTTREALLLKRLTRTKKLYAMLRLHRDELFDGEFQVELESMYRDTGAGKAPVPPALLAMAMLLQAYEGASDAEAVELTVVDLRWQLVLGRLGEEEPAFAQGTLREFRERMIRYDMDRRLLERTSLLAVRSGIFDRKKLPKTLRVAIDSSPLEGAGRVEDTINLLGHAARKVVGCAAELLGWTFDNLVDAAGIPMLKGPSVKASLDIEWADPAAKAKAIHTVVAQLDSLQAWLRQHLSEATRLPPLKDHVDALAQIRSQDLEPDPSGGGGGAKIRQGVAPERRVSIEDSAMRHGRKSKSKRFNGYKRHLAVDLETGLIVACAVSAANRPEEESAVDLKSDIERQERQIAELHCDRGYIASPVINDILAAGGDVLCKPWVPRNGNLFSKSHFTINLRNKTITCPAGEIESFDLGADVEFEPATCASCPLRSQCTNASPERGRSVSIADDEHLQKKLRKLTATRSGRARLRERVMVEHKLAHLGRRQGDRARYRGIRRNLYDVRRSATVQNLELVDRRLSVAPAAARKAA